MNCIKSHIQYFKDNPNGYWFKRNLYGWGWTPVKWQGWLVIAGFVAVLVVSDLSLMSIQSPTDADITWFFVEVVASITLLLWICYKKGERPRWQWGLPKDSNQN